MVVRLFRTIVVLAVCVAAASAQVDLDKVSVDPMATQRVLMVREMYASIPPAILGVVEPIEFSGVKSYKAVLGGGFFSFTDSRGTVFSFRSGGPPYSDVEIPKELVDHLQGRDYGRLSQVEGFHGSFVSPGYDVRGPEESELYGILIRWAASNALLGEDWSRLGFRLGQDESIEMQGHKLLRYFDYRFCGYTEKEWERWREG